MNAYQLAKETYASLGVDTEAALNRLAAIPLSLPCWQGDDVQGFEGAAGQLATDSRSLAITPAAPAPWRNSGPTSTRRSRLSPAGIA